MQGPMVVAGVGAVVTYCQSSVEGRSCFVPAGTDEQQHIAEIHIPEHATVVFLGHAHESRPLLASFLAGKKALWDGQTFQLIDGGTFVFAPSWLGGQGEDIEILVLSLT